MLVKESGAGCSNVHAQIATPTMIRKLTPKEGNVEQRGRSYRSRD